MSTTTQKPYLFAEITDDGFGQLDDAIAHSKMGDRYNASSDLTFVTATVEIQTSWVRALVTWGGPQMDAHALPIKVEATALVDLASTRLSDRFSNAVDHLETLAREIGRRVGSDVVLRSIDSYGVDQEGVDYGSRILHLTAVEDGNGVSHLTTYIGGQPQAGGPHV